MPSCLKCGTELPVNEEGLAPVLCDRCAGVATKRARRTLNTGTMRDYPVTTALVAINLTVFVGMLVTGGFDFQNSARWGANVGPYTIGGQYWRLISSEFVHGNFLHIAFNMWCLWSLGQLAERLFGKWQTLVLYLLTGAGGSLLSIAYNHDRWSVGASGAIFGIAGAIISGLKFGNLAVSEWQRRSAISSMVSFVAINFFLGGLGNTDNMCHLGGFATGLIIGLPLSAFGEKNKSLQAGMLLLTGVLLAAGMRELVQADGHRARLVAANTEMTLKNPSGAIEFLLRDISANPNSPESYEMLGQAYWLNNEPEKAVEAHKKALQLDPRLSNDSETDAVPNEKPTK